MNTHPLPAITGLHGIVKVFLSQGLYVVEKCVMWLDSESFKKVNAPIRHADNLKELNKLFLQQDLQGVTVPAKGCPGHDCHC